MNNSLKLAVRTALVPAVLILGGQSALACDDDKHMKSVSAKHEHSASPHEAAQHPHSGSVKHDAAHHRSANKIIDSWPQPAQKAAQDMMRQYGQPDGITDTMLVWHDNGPWVRTIVHRDEVRHNFPLPHGDVLEQFIRYEVPVDKIDDLARYDGSVVTYRTNGELAARCDTEGANFLALNLAKDIIDGERNVEEARAYYARTMNEVMSGAKPDYVRGLQFKTQNASAAFADEPFDMTPFKRASNTYKSKQQDDADKSLRVSTATDSRDDEVAVHLHLDTMSAEDLEDRKVLTLDGKIVGDVEGMGYSSAHGENVIIVEIGGILGIGDKDVALPLSKLGLTPDGHIQTSWTERDFENAPDTEEDSIEGWDD